MQTAHFAKWPALAATGGLLAFGLRESQTASQIHDDVERSIIAGCKYGPSICQYDANGLVTAGDAPDNDPGYRAAKARATRLIVASELGLVSTGAMFLVDLINRSDAPRNIPFTPFTVYATPRRIGLSLRL